MFVCGGASTWRSVCVGVVNVLRNWRSRAGRHLANAPKLRGPGRRCRPGRSRRCPGRRREPCCRRPAGRGPWRSRPASAPARRVVGGFSRPVMVCRCPPVLNVATIFGTVPSWCSASSISPLDTSDTPDSAAIRFACDCGNVSCVPGRKKSCTKCWPGLPSFDRSVRTDWFAWITCAGVAAAARGPAKPPVLLLLRRERDRQVGADARERVQRRLLRLVEPAGERDDRDHEADADRESEHGEDRPRLAAQQLVAQVREVEQRVPIQPPQGEDGLRPAEGSRLAGFRRCAAALPGSSPCR